MLSVLHRSSLQQLTSLLLRREATLGEGNMLALMRGALSRQTYYEKKWNWMNLRARSGIHSLAKVPPLYAYIQLDVADMDTAV